MATRLHVRDCLCLHTRRTARLLTQFYDEALRPSGLRITQFLLMAAIHEAEPITHQPLADILGMDRTTLTRNLALLGRDGLTVIVKGTRTSAKATSASPLPAAAPCSVPCRTGKAPSGKSSRA